MIQNIASFRTPLTAALLATARGTLLIFFFPDVPLALVRQMGRLP